MKIDVIIPTFNRAHVLERAINSVLNQKYQDFNLTIVDDGSHDETAHILKKYEGQKKILILRQENKGVSAARNLGIRNSNAPWISFLDSDDEWLPQKLQVQIDYLRKNPSCHFVHSDEIWIRNGVRINPKKKFDKSNTDIFRRSLETCLISPSTVLLKRDFIQNMGCFDESLKICEDYDLWIKTMLETDVHYIPELLIKKYGGHSDQLSSAYFEMDHWKIKSLMNILRTKTMSEEKKNILLLELEKKSEIHLAGLIKHGHQDQHQELSCLLKDFIRSN